MLMVTNSTVQRIFHWIKAQTAFICHQRGEEEHPQGWSWYLTFTLTFDSLMQLPVLLHLPMLLIDRQARLSGDGV